MAQRSSRYCLYREFVDAYMKGHPEMTRCVRSFVRRSFLDVRLRFLDFASQCPNGMERNQEGRGAGEEEDRRIFAKVERSRTTGITIGIERKEKTDDEENVEKTGTFDRRRRRTGRSELRSGRH